MPDRKDKRGQCQLSFFVGLGWFAYWEDFPSLPSFKGHIEGHVCGNERRYRTRAGHRKSVGKIDDEELRLHLFLL